MLFKVKADVHFEGEVYSDSKEGAQERVQDNLAVISYRPQVLNISEFECELNDDNLKPVDDLRE